MFRLLWLPSNHWTILYVFRSYGMVGCVRIFSAALSLTGWQLVAVRGRPLWGWPFPTLAFLPAIWDTYPFFTAVSIPKHPYPRHATRLCVFIYLYTPPSPSQIRFTNSVGMLETKPPRPCGTFVFQAITLAGTRAVLFWYDEIPKCEVPVVFEAFPSGFETAICNLTKWTCFWFKSFQ